MDGLREKSKSYARVAAEAAAAEKAKRAQNLPQGIYNVIYADPPWLYDNQGVLGAAQKHYAGMPLDDICALPRTMNLRTDANAVLFLWATNPLLAEALRVVEAWGFEYKTNLVWVKTNLEKPGSGWYVRGRHELLLIATRGSFTPLENVSPPIGSVLEAPIDAHSRKPDDAYRIIERLYPSCRYLELFARRQTPRPGWDYWGDEAHVDG
ncbi:MAG: DNA methyltransferase [Verrucomicrobiae bacterium]|nr:DNA methyltransferase [Verrucomicrobiae bacterium]